MRWPQRPPGPGCASPATLRPTSGSATPSSWGQETFEHLAEMEELLALTIAARAWVVPTMVLWEVGVIGLGDPETLAAYPEMRYWPPVGVEVWGDRLSVIQARAGWDEERTRLHAANRTRLLGIMNEPGVAILMGTDSPQVFSVPGFSIHRELAAMAEAGMSP